MARRPATRAALLLAAALLAACALSARAEDAAPAPAEGADAAPPAEGGADAPPAEGEAPAAPAEEEKGGEEEKPKGDGEKGKKAADAAAEVSDREAELLSALGEDRGMEARLSAYKALIELKNTAVADALAGRDDARRDVDATRKRNAEMVEQLSVVRAAAEEFKRGAEIKKADAEKCLGLKKETDAQLAQASKDLASVRDQLARRRVEAEDPTLSRWVQRRVQGVGAMFSDERNGRLLGEAVGGALDGARDRVAALEMEVESRAGAPPLLAGLLCALAVTLPLYVLYVTVPRMTKAISYRQHLLIGHVFNITVLLCALGSAVSTGVDPLVTISRTPSLRVLLSTVFLMQWVAMFTFIVHSALHATSLRDQRACFLHFVAFALLCFHCKNRTFPNLVRASSGEVWLYINLRFYAGYIIALGGLIVLTISGAQSEKQEGIVSDISSLLEGSVGGLQSEVMGIVGSGKDSRRFSSRSLPRTPPHSPAPSLPISMSDSEKLN